MRERHRPRPTGDGAVLEREIRALLPRIAASVAVSRGVTVLLEGGDPPGKVAVASALARRLWRPLYLIDLSYVVSGYVGETERNLARVFARAEEHGALLLLDEADVLFGQRTDVRDAHDRYADKAIAYLLRRIESHPGIVVLAVTEAPRLRRRSRRRRVVLDLG